MPEAVPVPQIGTSPAEQEANAAKLNAEAEKALAEAKVALVDAETRQYEARAALARTIETELKSAQAVEADKARRASDEYHRVYRFDGEVTASSVHACMGKLTEWHRLDPSCTIEVIFSSPGGSIFDGMELFDWLRDLSAKGHQVITGGLGMAASMAGILLMAGDHRWIGGETWVLIHRAAFLTFGSTYEVEDMVQLIRRIEKRIIDIFVDRSGGKLTAQKVQRNWNRKDWWLDSKQCLEFGLVDEVR